MSQLNPSQPIPKANPVELTATAVNYFARKLPSGTAYCLALVFIVMMTGRWYCSSMSLRLPNFVLP